VKKLKSEVKEARTKCKEKDEKLLQKLIEKLPDTQKEAVMACYKCAKAKRRQGRRYTLEWVYECILLRTKGPALYDMIREKDIPPVPKRETLNACTRAVGAACGFQDSIFQQLAEKTAHMPDADKRGNINLFSFLSLDFKIQPVIPDDFFTQESYKSTR